MRTLLFLSLSLVIGCGAKAVPVKGEGPASTTSTSPATATDGDLRYTIIKANHRTGFIHLTVKVENTSADKLIYYPYLDARPGNAAGLYDDKENTYRRTKYPNAPEPKGLKPGESLKEELIFDTPLSQAKELTLVIEKPKGGGDILLKFSPSIIVPLPTK